MSENSTVIPYAPKIVDPLYQLTEALLFKRTSQIREILESVETQDPSLKFMTQQVRYIMAEGGSEKHLFAHWFVSGIRQLIVQQAFAKRNAEAL